MSTLRQDADGGNRAGRAGPAGRANAALGGGARAGDAAAAPDGAGAGTGGRVTGVGVLDRSVLLLDLLAAGPRTLRWLAGASGLPRPTAYRLLVALEAHRLVARDATGAFRLGPRLTELAAAAGPALDLAALAGPVLARLHEATGESVQLYVRSGNRRLCVAARDAGTGLRDTVPVGALLPLDAGSGGKVLRAWSPDAEADPEAAELAAIRRRGWAASVAEREPGVASVSAPVLASSVLASSVLASSTGASSGLAGAGPASSGPAGSALAGGALSDGALLGALCISGPASRIGPAPGRRLAPLVTGAAAELSRLAAAP